ncbi:m-phase inducer phosphatase [Coemansia sp. RSA 989]|nr:m-phase inducer phosphatase [Coemansia sp. RSA 989]KAJ1874924.1 m-phase inducer phosphatase [Coemansia sp. RSA 990]KAJ2649115.1 m-phase inducer phosphatase [Coemansia sp. RSA 1250]KAJ2671526.1 m-phase inducer phosphatase [Coemansia sp. RSA 1085]
MNTVASDRLSSCLRGIGSPNPFTATPRREAGNSPVSGLASELNSSLHLDSSPGRPPAFEPFSAHESQTPLLSRKRPIEDMGSPSLNTPTAFWSRSRGKRAQGHSLLSESPFASRSLLGESPFASRSPALPLVRDSTFTDEESSFDDDGSLTNLPRMRGSAIKTILEDQMLECTPLKASKIKRARSRTAGIPSFSSELGANFSPSAKAQECHQLPCSTAPTDPIMRVEAETVSQLLNGKYRHLYDEQIIVDCRFPYEYEGGHIAGAVNAPTAEALESLLLTRPPSDKRVVVVLHCEYSIQRAPSMASLLRRRDREVNMHRYPALHYPEIYVLKGGYRNFFSFFKHECEPQSYVEMNDQAFASDCRQRMVQFNRQFKRTKSMNDSSLSRSFSATVAGSALFMQSPTMPQRSSSSSSSLPARARRLGRTQSARPGINLIDFAHK